MKKILCALVIFIAFSGMAFAAVNLNTATKEELDAVKGIGPVKAQAIIDYRTQNGPFSSVDDLKKVKGFGDKTVAKMRGDLSVSGATTLPAIKDKAVKSVPSLNDKGSAMESKAAMIQSTANQDTKADVAKTTSNENASVAKAQTKADKAAAKAKAKADKKMARDAAKADKAAKKAKAKADKEAAATAAKSQ